MAIQIVSTRNAGTPVTGSYREDLAQGDLVGLALSSLVGVTNVRWELVGRPEGSAAGGAGPEPVLLANAPTASFTVDSDAGSFRLDGSYKVQATINPGSPGQVRITAVLARLSGVTVPGPGSSLRTLRKLGGFEALEDVSITTILLGWATQLNRWLELIRVLASGGGGAAETHTYSIDPMEDSSGAEVAQTQTQKVVNMDDFGATVAIAVGGTGFSQSGTATVRVYVAGTDGNLDGTEVATVSVPAGTGKRTTSATFPNPGGEQYLIFSIESSAAGQDAQYRDVTMVLQ